jgi:hypothetical protein
MLAAGDNEHLTGAQIAGHNVQCMYVRGMSARRELPRSLLTTAHEKSDSRKAVAFFLPLALRFQATAMPRSPVPCQRVPELVQFCHSLSLPD